MSQAREPRDQRVDIRLSASQRALLEKAAAASDSSMSAFVLDAASREAERLLSERTTFVLDAENWARFERLLCEPARELPGLASLLERPTPFSNS